MMELEDALLLLSVSKRPRMPVKDAVEIIELVTKNPDDIKHVLKTAEERGLILRDGLDIVFTEGADPFPKPRIKRVDCESSCRRCGVRIKNCFYIDLDDHMLGPYGSECVNKIL